MTIITRIAWFPGMITPSSDQSGFGSRDGKL